MNTFRLLLLLCCIGPAVASASAQTWVEARSPHFVVMTDDGAKQAVHLADQFERMRAVFHSVFPGASLEDGPPMLVIATRDRAGLRAVEPAGLLAKGQADAVGVFLRCAYSNFILLRLDVNSPHPFAPIYHEYTHYMVRSSEDWLPVWLNEGLASFFENTDIHQKDVDLGQVNADELEYLRHNPLLPLQVLLSAGPDSPYYRGENRANMFYSESWALVHYLQITDNKENTHRLADYAERVSQHQDPVKAAVAAFGNLDLLARRLQSYIAEGRFAYFRVASPPVMDPASFQIITLTSGQADAQRAEVLANGGRQPEARKLLNAVLAQDPENGSAWRTMGYLDSEHDHDLAAAQKNFAKAIHFDPQDYLAHYFFAVTSMQTGDAASPEQIERSFQAAIRLNPLFAPGYDALAAFYAKRHEHLDEAHLLNNRADELDPGNLTYRIHTAQVLQASGRTADALRVLKAAEPLANTPEQKASLSKHMQHLSASDTQAAESATSKQPPGSP